MISIGSRRRRQAMRVLLARVCAFHSMWGARSRDTTTDWLQTSDDFGVAARTHNCALALGLFPSEERVLFCNFSRFVCAFVCLFLYCNTVEFALGSDNYADRCHMLADRWEIKLNCLQ